jgi:RNA polymerase sigma factor (sigma-70 family)
LHFFAAILTVSDFQGEISRSTHPYNLDKVPKATCARLWAFMKKAFPMMARRTMVMAVVVGAALAGTPHQQAAAGVPGEKAVNDISRYCQACWRNARLHPDTWPDATQEVFTRLLERVEPSRWSSLLKMESDERREFLRAIDAVKKRTQRGRKHAGLAEDVADHRSLPEAARSELREVLDRASREILSQRQQRILQLNCAGWSIPEIADELHTTVERISDEKYKAIRKLRSHLNA